MPRLIIKAAFFIFISFILVILPIKTSLMAQSHESCDHDHDHSGHAHAKVETETEVSQKATEHQGHGHEGHEHSDACNQENAEEIELSAEQQRRNSISMATAKTGKIDRQIILNGKIAVNNELVSHHVARTSGIAARIMVQTGEYVRKGETLAILDSAELGQTKSEFYEIFNNTNISIIELKRASVIRENTHKLIESLKGDPEPELLQKKANGDMGEYRALLLSSYAEYVNRKKAFSRRQSLYKDKIISENDFLLTQSSYEKAQADFLSQLDLARFQTTRNHYEAEKQHKINEFKLRTAERKLFLLGLTPTDIENLKTHGSTMVTECLDPVCSSFTSREQKHFHENSAEEFSQIAIRAQRSGIVIDRQIETGEEIEANRVVFTIADLRNLWALLQVPGRDLQLIKPGMPIYLRSENGDQVEGLVDMLIPVVDERTRTATMRVNFSNDGNRWFPGQFITGRSAIDSENSRVLIHKNAVQNINGDRMVFIKGKKGFLVTDVRTGGEDQNMIEIISGLKPGQEYVATGAFVLKAMIVTSGMDPHAGHGH